MRDAGAPLGSRSLMHGMACIRRSVGGMQHLQLTCHSFIHHILVKIGDFMYCMHFVHCMI